MSFGISSNAIVLCSGASDVSVLFQVSLSFYYFHLIFFIILRQKTKAFGDSFFQHSSFFPHYTFYHLVFLKHYDRLKFLHIFAHFCHVNETYKMRLLLKKGLICIIGDENYCMQNIPIDTVSNTVRSLLRKFDTEKGYVIPKR